MDNQLTKTSSIDPMLLLKRAADVMDRDNRWKAELESRAQSMVTHAQEEIKIVERLLQASEAARAAEAQKAQSRIEEIEKACDAKLKAAEEQSAAIEARANAAELRAQQAKDELARLQAAIADLFKREHQEAAEAALPNDEAHTTE